MKRLFTTLFAGIALLVSLLATLPVTAQTEYTLYGHLVGTRENNGIYKFTTASTSNFTEVQKYHIHPTMAL